MPPWLMRTRPAPASTACSITRRFTSEADVQTLSGDRDLVEALRRDDVWIDGDDVCLCRLCRRVEAESVRQKEVPQ